MPDAMTEPHTGSILAPLVERLGKHVKLDQADREALHALPYSVQRLDRHQNFVREGEIATHCCLMLSGFSMRLKTLRSGNRQILAIHMKGEMVDLQNSLLKTADHSVQMLTPGKVAVISRADITHLAIERPAVGMAMWLDTLIDGSISREWIANVGRRDARTRVAHLLCEFALRLDVTGVGKELGYELPMTQEQLADATGLTSVHINRTLKALEKEELIDRATPRMIHIGNWKRLTEAGEFDPGYLHLDLEST